LHKSTSRFTQLRQLDYIQNRAENSLVRQRAVLACRRIPVNLTSACWVSNKSLLLRKISKGLISSFRLELNRDDGPHKIFPKYGGFSPISALYPKFPSRQAFLCEKHTTTTLFLWIMHIPEITAINHPVIFPGAFHRAKGRRRSVSIFMPASKKHHVATCRARAAGF